MSKHLKSTKQTSNQNPFPIWYYAPRLKTLEMIRLLLGSMAWRSTVVTPPMRSTLPGWGPLCSLVLILNEIWGTECSARLHGNVRHLQQHRTDVLCALQNLRKKVQNSYSGWPMMNSLSPFKKYPKMVSRGSVSNCWYMVGRVWGWVVPEPLSSDA